MSRKQTERTGHLAAQPKKASGAQVPVVSGVTAGERNVLQRDVAGLIACVLAGVFVLSLSWCKLSSLDIGYHVAYGRHFLETGKIVGFEADPFLRTETGVPFVNANWGSQVVMALAERWGEAAGLTILRVGLIAVIFTAIAMVVRTGGSSWLAVAMAWVLAALGAYERFSMRPELFSYAMMMLQLAILTRGVKSWRSVVAIALLQVAWVNLHSYFLVGVLMCGAFWAGDLWRVWQSPSATPEGVASRTRFRLMSIALGLVVAMSFVHPWGWKAATFPFRTLEFLQSSDAMGGSGGAAEKSAWAEISEFQSPFSFAGERINQFTIWAYFGLLVMAAGGVIACLRRKAIGPLLFILILFAMSTQMRRNTAQFALAATPLAIVAIGSLLSCGRLTKTRRVLAITTCMACVAGVTSVASGWMYFSERRISREFGFGFNALTFPADAVAWLAAHDELQPELFVDYFSSSNSLPGLPSRFKLLVDTNTFAYREETLKLAFDVGIGKVGHGPFLDQYGINVVLLHGGPDTQALVGAMMRDNGNWALVHVDSVAVVFVRRIQAHVSIILDSTLTEEGLDAARWIAATTGPAAARAMTIGTIASVPISLGWWSSAAVLCEEAVKLRPDYVEAWINLGLCRGNQANSAARGGRRDEAVTLSREAIRCFEAALAFEPENKIAAANLQRAKASIGVGP